MGCCLLAASFAGVETAAAAGNAHTRNLYPDAAVTQSDGSGVTITYTPQFLPQQQIAEKNEKFLRFPFNGYQPDRQRPGDPEQMHRTITVRLPGNKGNSVDVVSSDFETVSNVSLAPAPLYRKGDAGVQRSYTMNPKAYNISAFLPQTLAHLSDVGETRGRILGNVDLNPYQYDPATRTLRKYTRITVRVNFGPRTGVRSLDDGMSAGIAINDAQVASVHAPRSMRSALALHNSVLATGTWYKFPVTSEGMYKITGTQLLALGIPASTDPATIRIFGNGGAEPPIDATAPAIDDLVENAIIVNDGGTPHQLDASDYIIMYGKGTRGWTYDPAGKTVHHYLNHFTETNYYWLTYGGVAGKRMVSTSAPYSGSFTPKTVLGYAYREDERVNVLMSGLDWLGQAFVGGDDITYVTPLTGIDVTQAIVYRLQLDSQAPDYSAFAVYEHNTLIANPLFDPIDIGGYDEQMSVMSPGAVLVPTFTDGQSVLKFSYTSSSSAGTGYIDWYEILYQRALIAGADVCSFYAYDSTTTAGYSIAGFTGNAVAVYNIVNGDSAVAIAPSLVSNDTCYFANRQTGGESSEYLAIGPTGYQSVSGFVNMPNQNLHGDTSSASYIIVAPPDFLGAAERLKSFRELPGDGYLKTQIVDVTQIYNEFGGGLPSTYAVRNYFKYLFANASPQPKYVLLFGAGTYDYKDIATQNTQYILPWETPESFDALYSYASDDYFSFLDGSTRVSFGIGRITATSVDVANNMVNKIIEYESNPVIDPWKITATFVADDGPADPGVTDLFIHTNDAEEMAATVPDLFTKVKIYEYAYPLVITAAGRRRPEVNAAIDAQINQGTLLLNFNGHGNPYQWTHEAVFVNQVDFPNLHNKGKYFFLVAATCNYSAYDQTYGQSGGELLSSMPAAGGIGAFSATRAVLEVDNAYLNSIFLQQLFAADAQGNIVRQRMGDVIYHTKEDPVVTGDANDEKFFLLGDPGLRFALPQQPATVDSIDHISTAQTVQLQALSNASVAMSVHDTAQPFSGKSLMQVFDANKTLTFMDYDYESPPVAFYDTVSIVGDVLFRGEESVSGSKMSAKFVVPKDISYSNAFGKVNAYFWNSTTDGGAYTENVRIGGTDTAAAHPTKGPTMQIYFNSRTFRSGDVVGANPTLLVDLQDAHGINTSGAGVGHSIQAWIDQSSTSIDLTQYFESAIDNYQEGTVQYVLNGLSAGTHTIRVQAWDTYDLPTVGQTMFSVESSTGLALSDVFNYPNPFSSNTIFSFKYPELGAVNVTVKIYTVAGRTIQSLQRNAVSSTNQIARVSWDGRDKEGHTIANGIYLYKIIVTSQDSRFSSEALGKLTVLR